MDRDEAIIGAIRRLIREIKYSVEEENLLKDAEWGLYGNSCSLPARRRGDLSTILAAHSGIAGTAGSFEQKQQEKQQTPSSDGQCLAVRYLRRNSWRSISPVGAHQRILRGCCRSSPL